MTIFGPSRELAKSAASFARFKEKLDLNFKNLEYVGSKAFSGGAKKQRSSDFSTEIISEFKDKILAADVVIVESQPLFMLFLAEKNTVVWNGKLVYWCPVCATSKKSRSFLEASRDIDRLCFTNADHVIVATEEQAEYVEECGIPNAEVTVLNEFIDRSLPMFKDYSIDEEALSIINNELDAGKMCLYLPFRLSDEGYKIWETLDLVHPLVASGQLVLFAPNVNGASIDELVKLCRSSGSALNDDDLKMVLSSIRPISSSRDTYYTLIDHCPSLVIPYFEDWKFVMHAAVDELICGSVKPACAVLGTKDELRHYLQTSVHMASALSEIKTKKVVMDQVLDALISSKSFKRLVLEASVGDELPSFIFAGVGKNWYICEKVVKTFISMGIQAQALDPTHALHGDLGMLKAPGKKILVFVSRSGTTAELVKLAKVVKALKDKHILAELETVALFLNKSKPNPELFDTWILPDDISKLDSIYEFDGRDLVPSLSINILQMVLDLLGVLLYESRDELVAGYVYNHLSGGNGEKLGGAAILKDIH